MGKAWLPQAPRDNPAASFSRQVYVSATAQACALALALPCPHWVERRTAFVPTTTSPFSYPYHSWWLQGLDHRHQGLSIPFLFVGLGLLIKEVGAEANLSLTTCSSRAQPPQGRLWLPSQGRCPGRVWEMVQSPKD